MHLHRDETGRRQVLLIVACLIALVGCGAPTAPPPITVPLREITILYTSDEHGYLEPQTDGSFSVGGATSAEGSWLAAGLNPLDEGDQVLLLSGGDNLTGPAISTWFDGTSTIEVMNAMGYRCSVVGNHEFDFGLDVLKQRIEEAAFPYLAGNIVDEATGRIPEWVTPYKLVEVNGVRVGVIGLALKDTPLVTSARNVAGLRFGDYVAALSHWAPKAREDGAELLIVAAHVCPKDLMALADQTRDLGISFYFGGHCHQALTSSVGEARVAATTAHWADYVRTTFIFDKRTATVVDVEQRIVEVLYPKGKEPRPRSTTSALVAKWTDRTNTVLGETIAYSVDGVDSGDPTMVRLLLGSWLWAYPADVAITNSGGFRASLPAGGISVADLVEVLPFENELVEIEVRGRALMAAMKSTSPQLVAGTDAQPAGLDLDSLNPDQTYRVVTTDYVYENVKYPFQRLDATPYATGIHWRQPVIDWLRVHDTDVHRPIEKVLPH